jgi:hypothetical protein
VSERKTEAELLAALERCPAVDSCWRHYKGGVYYVLGRCVRESDGEPLVIYSAVGGRVDFARPLSEWSEWLFHNGEQFQRFTPID